MDSTNIKDNKDYFEDEYVRQYKQYFNRIDDEIAFEFDTVNTELFTEMFLNDKRQPSICDFATNRQFEIYDVPVLQACSKDKDKIMYKTCHMVEDMCWFFNYLPKSEINRMVRCLFWLIKEGLKNYGYVQVPGFGKFCTYDRPSVVRYNMSTGERYTTRRMKLKRNIDFTPFPAMQYFITPRDILHMRIGSNGVSETREFPLLFNSFVYEKRHRRQGQLLMQNVFDREFKYQGYSDSYITAIYNGEIEDEQD